jgi:hypothetical protein
VLARPYVTPTEANAAFEVRPLNFRKGKQMSADYPKLNFKHKVPLLIVDGKLLHECGDPDLYRPHFSAGEAVAGRSLAGAVGELDSRLVRLGIRPDRTKV